MSNIIMTEDELAYSTIPDPLDHRSMIASIGVDLTPW